MAERGASRADEWLIANGGVVLIAGGVALVTATLVLAPADAVGVVMATMGAGMALVGVLLPNIEGDVKLGPSGMEATLRRVYQRAVEQGLDDEDRALAVGDAYQALTAGANDAPAPTASCTAGGHRGSREASGKAATTTEAALVDHIIRGFLDTEPIPPNDVPDEALDAVSRAAGGIDIPRLEEAQQRVGRGAPRWHLRLSDGTWWRVSHTVHGWIAKGFDPPSESRAASAES